jgi:hypothetical protein
MSFSTVYYFREKPVQLVTHVNHKAYLPAIRRYFEDFLIDCLKIHSFERAIFYVDAQTKTIESLSVFQGYFDKVPRLEKFINELSLKILFAANLENSPYLVVDHLIRKIETIFTDKMKFQDYYDIDIHVRLLGKKMPSFSSDHYRLRLDFTSLKLKQFIQKQGFKPEEFNVEDPKMKITITPTSYKALFHAV